MRVDKKEKANQVWWLVWWGCAYSCFPFEPHKIFVTGKRGIRIAGARHCLERALGLARNADPKNESLTRLLYGFERAPEALAQTLIVSGNRRERRFIKVE